MIPKPVKLISDENFQHFRKTLDDRSRTSSAIPLTLKHTGSGLPDYFSGSEQHAELDLDIQRRYGLLYAVLTRKHLIETFEKEKHSKAYMEVVQEDPIPTIRATFGGMLFGPPDLSRKLKPMRISGHGQRQVTF